MSERPETDHELVESSPNAGGPDRAAGGMGVSSERVGATGGGTDATDGEKDTTAPRRTDQVGDPVGSDADGSDADGSDAAGDQDTEENPVGITPKAGYPSKDPRSENNPAADA